MLLNRYRQMGEIFPCRQPGRSSDRLREDLQATQDALDEEQSASGRHRDNLRGARQALDEVRAPSAYLRAELHAARIEAAQNMAAMMADRSRMLYDLEETRSRLEQVLRERDSVLTSTTWLASRPVRAVVDRMPSILRAFGRRVLRVIWWTVTLQLPTRLRHRRELVRLASGKPRAGELRKAPISGQVHNRHGEFLREQILGKITVTRGGLKSDQVERLKQLEAENTRLRRAVSDLTRQSRPM
jgi:hypothetical protein